MQTILPLGSVVLINFARQLAGQWTGQFRTRPHALLDVSAEDMDCPVQAGITRLALNSELRHTGLRHARRRVAASARALLAILAAVQARGGQQAAGWLGLG